MSPFLVSGRAHRGLMARGKKPPQPGRAKRAHGSQRKTGGTRVCNAVKMLGGTGFLLDRPGGGFSDAVNQAVCGCRKQQEKRGRTCRTNRSGRLLSPTVRSDDIRGWTRIRACGTRKGEATKRKCFRWCVTVSPGRTDPRAGGRPGHGLGPTIMDLSAHRAVSRIFHTRRLPSRATKRAQFASQRG